MKRNVKRLFILILCGVILFTPMVVFAINNSKLFIKEEKKEQAPIKKEKLEERDTSTKFVDEVKEQEQKAFVKDWKKDRQDEAEKDLAEKMSQVPFGEKIQLNLNEDKDMVDVSIISAVELNNSDDRYDALMSGVSDAEQLIEVTYELDVIKGSATFNGQIFKYFDTAGEQGAVLLDEHPKGKKAKEYEQTTNKTVVAFRQQTKELTATISGVTFIGEVKGSE